MARQKKIILELEYPCSWVYKIIGTDIGQMRQAVAEIMGDCRYTITHSRSSKTDKYHCLNVDLRVESAAQRLGLYRTLQSHQAVKLVL
ncbi:MAG: DUF493 domain-containing protein [Deltaproteobacteria bacterium]|nr:DUF493 domain-containing protein [Deltaproteobacteria bacterium]